MEKKELKQYYVSLDCSGFEVFKRKLHGFHSTTVKDKKEAASVLGEILNSLFGKKIEMTSKKPEKNKK
jgi:hypothetical protein